MNLSSSLSRARAVFPPFAVRANISTGNGKCNVPDTQDALWIQAVNSLKDMMRDLKEDLRSMRVEVDKIRESHEKDQQIIRDTFAECQKRCNHERASLWQTVDRHREKLSRDEGAQEERVKKGQVDYVFWTKIAAIFTSISVLGVIAWHIILAIFNRI